MNKNSTLARWFESQGFPLLSDIRIDNSFEPAVVYNDLIFVSSATPMRNDGTEVKGKVGFDIDVIGAKNAACLCLAHSLSLLRDALGEPIENKIVKAIDLTFFINAIPTFDNHSEIADAASNLLIGSLGRRGVHARSAIGVGSLVRNVSVVLKAIYQIKARKIKDHSH